MAPSAFAAPLACLIAMAGCAAAPGAMAAGSTEVSTEQLVQRNEIGAAILAAIRKRGVSVVARDSSAIESLSDAPGHAFQAGAGGWLHLHVYSDSARAAQASARLIANSRSPTQMIHWIAPPHAFHCRALVVLYLGEDPRVLGTLTQICGAGVSLRP